MNNEISNSKLYAIVIFVTLGVLAFMFGGLSLIIYGFTLLGQISASAMVYGIIGLSAVVMIVAIVAHRNNPVLYRHKTQRELDQEQLEYEEFLRTKHDEELTSPSYSFLPSNIWNEN